MTPTLEEIANEILKVAQKKNINLDIVDIKWLSQIVKGAQMCDFKTRDLFVAFINEALNHIPKQAIIN